ncbi:MAG: hypothetical protein JNJ58_06815 [Chitinophagaceae bacterium]|nr:hypothetical protein [Chitinophagaceae bacterium]
MNQFYKYMTYIFIGIAALLAVILIIGGEGFISAGTGLYFLCCGPLLFIAGIVFLCFPRTRVFGQSMLASSVLVFIFGFAICSNSKFVI